MSRGTGEKIMANKKKIKKPKKYPDTESAILYLCVETDRGCVMTLHALLDEELGKLLRDYAERDKLSLESFLTAVFEGASVQGLKRRTELALRLKLIPPKMAKALEALNELRNDDFGHVWESPKIKECHVTSIRKHLSAEDILRVDKLVKKASALLTTRLYTTRSKYRPEFTSVAAILWGNLRAIAETVNYDSSNLYSSLLARSHITEATK
jgi:hypothetical protein